jgi:hypothetical protein
MDRPRGSLGSFQRLVEAWATGVRAVEIERVIQALKEVRRGRERGIRGKRRDEA